MSGPDNRAQEQIPGLGALLQVAKATRYASVPLTERVIFRGGSKYQEIPWVRGPPERHPGGWVAGMMLREQAMESLYQKGFLQEGALDGFRAEETGLLLGFIGDECPWDGFIHAPEPAEVYAKAHLLRACYEDYSSRGIAGLKNSSEPHELVRAVEIVAGKRLHRFPGLYLSPEAQKQTFQALTDLVREDNDLVPRRLGLTQRDNKDDLVCRAESVIEKLFPFTL